MQTTCETCGLSKIQIHNSSNKKAKQMIKEGDKGKIVMTKARPNDVEAVPFFCSLALGLFGAHLFYVGRRKKAFIMLGLIGVTVLAAIIFPMGDWDNQLEGRHPWRVATDAWGAFPLDFLGLAAFVMWALDVFAVILGTFKYPVRLGDHPNAKKKEVTGE